MGFNSAEIAIADVVSRLADPTAQRAIEVLLEAADKGLGAEDRKTSELEVRDYLERNPEAFYTVPEPALQQVLDVLGTPSVDFRPEALVFQEVRTALARIAHDLEELQHISDPGPTKEQATAIVALERELARTVNTARVLAKNPQYSTIASYANAAIMRIGTFRKYGMFRDEGFATPLPLTPSKTAAIACLRLELAGARDAAERVSETPYTVMKGPPPQVNRLAGEMYRIRALLEEMQPEEGPTPREVAALNGDFNATLRLVATTEYLVRTRNTTAVIAKVGDVELPDPLVTTP